MERFLTTIRSGRTLAEGEAREAFDQILEGRTDEGQIRELLLGINARGATVDELTGAARAMRERVTRIPYPTAPGETVIDTCGTGGAPKTFNISTAAAIVVAAASTLAGSARRVRVAKHGNRSRTGRGSAEVLSALGVNVDAPPEMQAACLERAGVCFCFAIHHHPAAKFAAGVRREIGVPTIFNLLGPLTNPALAPRQLLGVFDARFVRPMAEALHRLGSERAMVLHSEDGLDEISTAARTRFAEVIGMEARGGVSARVVREGAIDPLEFGVRRASLDDLRAGSVEEAAGIVRAVLGGEAGARRDIVLVNAAAGLCVAGAAEDMRAGLTLAAEAVDSGAAAGVLAALARASRGA